VESCCVTLHAYGHNGLATDVWMTYWANWPAKIQELTTYAQGRYGRTIYTGTTEIATSWGGVTLASSRQSLEVWF